MDEEVRIEGSRSPLAVHGEWVRQKREGFVKWATHEPSLKEISDYPAEAEIYKFLVATNRFGIVRMLEALSNGDSKMGIGYLIQNTLFLISEGLLFIHLTYEEPKSRKLSEDSMKEMGKWMRHFKNNQDERRKI